MLNTVFPHIRPAGVIISHGLQIQIIIVGIIQGRALYEDILLVLRINVKKGLTFG